MKMKNVYPIIGLIGGLFINGVSCAHENLNPYIGGEFGYNKFKYTTDEKDFLQRNNLKIKTKAPSVTVIFGIRPHENFGTEVGYTLFKKIKMTDATDGNERSIKQNQMYIDLLGYMPIDKCFELIGSFGIGRTYLKNSYHDGIANIDSTSKQYVGELRFGGGIQYNFDEHFSTKVMARYNVLGTKDDCFKRSISVNLGLIYNI